MRGVNIHVDFVMIQRTKNKKLTSLRINNTYGGCHPAVGLSSCAASGSEILFYHYHGFRC